MSATTRVNGSGYYTTGALVSVYQQKVIKVVVKDSSNTAVDLQSLDGPTADQLVEAVVREIQPLIYYTPSAASGEIYAVIDGHAVDADTLQLRVRHVVASVLGLVEADNDSTVAVGTQFVVS